MAELNTSLSRLQCLDIDGLEDVEACQERWFAEVMKALKVEEENKLTTEKFSVQTKAVSSRWLADAQDIMFRQREMMDSMKQIIELMKSEALGDKEKVIGLQSELLERRDEQLKYKTEQMKSLQDAVQTTVKDTVKTEIRSYGDAVKKNLNSSTAIPPQTLKKVVRNVMEVEDMSRNLLVFGLDEEPDEQLSDKIIDVLLQLGEKPRVEATRLGTKGSSGNKPCRPVKVRLGSSALVRQILTKSKTLKDIDRFKSVFVCPDRSMDERAVQKQLVLNRKKLSAEQPHLRHYIRGGKIWSVEKTGE